MPDNENIQNDNPADITEAEIIDEAKAKADAVEAERQRIDKTINLSSSKSIDINTHDMEGALALQHSALPEDQKIQNLTEMLEPMFKKYNERYNLDFKLDTFRKTIEFVVQSSEEKKELYRLINESIVVSIVEIVTIKAILTLSYVINNQLVNLQAPDLNNNWSVNTIMTVEKVFAWIDKLNELREKYKSFNIEGRIKRATEKMKDVEDHQNNPGDNSLTGINSQDDVKKMRLIDALQKALEEDDQIGG